MTNNWNRFLVVFVVAVTLWIAQSLPYLNLFLTSYVIFTILYLIYAIVFKLSAKTGFMVGLISLILSLPWLMTDNRVQAEGFGFFSFIVFLIALLQEVLESIREE